MHRFAPASFLLIVFLVGSSFGVADEPRQWTDSTGKFRITATLFELRDGTVYLKSGDGKTLKIPLDRLSKADQEFLTAGDNPFQMVDEAPPANIPSETSTGSPSAGRSSSMSAWQNPPQIDWQSVPELDRGFDEAQWNYTPPEINSLPFEMKRASLPKKTNFFEGMRRLKVNPLAKRCVAGYTLTFSVPKPLSRISLVDLPTGKAVNSDQVECNMCPLAVLNDGKTVLMQGTGKEREGYETGDQLQLWKLSGTQVSRSEIWIPFKDDKKSFGKVANATVTRAIPLRENRILLVGDNGHLACFDLSSLTPTWHARLPRNWAIELTTDRHQLFVMEEHTINLVDPISGSVKGRMQLQDKPPLGWCKMRLNDTGDKMLMSFVKQIRVVDLKTGETLQQHESSGPPISPNGLSYPAEDFALLNNNLLLHLPSKILLCEYQDAAAITSVGGTEFIGLLTDRGGLIVPSSMPHPRAKEMLEQAVDDPSVFLIHPGVNVSLNVSGVPGQHRATVEKNLREAAKTAGYQISSTAPITIKASVSGPKQEAVSYIARGAYVANKYTSSVSIESGGKSVWSRSGSNIPMVLSTSQGQSIQQKLDELGRQPNLGFFTSLGLPKLLQAPKNGGGNSRQNALLVSKFTLGGLVDSQ
jgi:hypothetical protein